MSLKRERARTSRVKSLIKRVHVTMDGYFALWKEYPSGDNLSDTWPKTYDTRGVDLGKSLVFRGTGLEEGTFNHDDFDATGGSSANYSGPTA